MDISHKLKTSSNRHLNTLRPMTNRRRALFAGLYPTVFVVCSIGLFCTPISHRKQSVHHVHPSNWKEIFIRLREWKVSSQTRCLDPVSIFIMKTSSNGNIFRVSGRLCGKFTTGLRVNSPHKVQWRGALMFSLICTWINAGVNDREAGDSRCYRSHYDVTVMIYMPFWQVYGFTL